MLDEKGQKPCGVSQPHDSQWHRVTEVKGGNRKGREQLRSVLTQQNTAKSGLGKEDN